MMEAVDDEVPKTFGDPVSALRWAYERHTRCAHYVQSTVPVQPRSPYDRLPTGDVDPRDLDMLAETITATLTQLPHAERCVLPAMYGDDFTRGAHLQAALSYLMELATDDAQAIDPATLRTLAHIALERGVSELEVQSRRSIRPPRRLYAQALGISQTSLNDTPYQRIVLSLEETVRRIRDSGLHDLRLRLEAIGVIR